MITAETLREHISYDPETGIFTRLKTISNRVKVGPISNRPNGHGHIYIRVEGYKYPAHRLAWFYVHGEWPENETDHINMNKLDNRISSLRKATSQQNQFNRDKMSNNTSGYAGVYLNKQTGKYFAAFRHNRKLHHLGHFDTPEQARAAYLAAISYRGEFMPLKAQKELSDGTP